MTWVLLLLLLWSGVGPARAQVLAAPAAQPMPQLVGVNGAEAVQRLHRLGLSAQALRTPSEQNGRVVQQSPRAGTRVEARTRILLYVGDSGLKVAAQNASVRAVPAAPVAARGGWGLFLLIQFALALTLWKVCWPLWKRGR